MKDIDKLIKEKKYDEAIKYYENLLNENPENLSYLKHIKELLYKPGMYKTKIKSKYYIKWIDTIISRNYAFICKSCGREELYHVVHGINGHAVVSVPYMTTDTEFMGNIDCDDDATHYCPECDKTYDLGIECINFNKDDETLYNFAVEVILYIKHQLHEQGIAREDLKQTLYREFYIDERNSKH